MSSLKPYVPPPYPYDRLNDLKHHGERFDTGLINLSIGAPCDPAPAAVTAAMGTADLVITYPQSIGSPEMLEACTAWLDRRFGIPVPDGHVAACVGTKEFVASLPGHLHLRRPDLDTVLYPEISYPTYEMGADMHGLRAVAVPVDEQFCLRLDAIDPADIARALCLWVNSPGNPAGGLEDLGAIAAWGRAHGVPVISDECYIEFTWDDPHGAPNPDVPGRSILEHGTEGVIALHSLSKRTNFAGGRAGFYAGDRDLVFFLSEVRKHSGMLVPGPMQLAAAVAFGDDAHVDEQRHRYRERLDVTAAALSGAGLDVQLPGGGFYLWIPAPGGDAWGLAEQLAERAGVLVSPGEFYGPAGAGYVRVAVVAQVERLREISDRLNGYQF